MGENSQHGPGERITVKTTALAFALYRRILSPLLHSTGLGGCKFQPTCSEYAEIAILRHGPLRGGWLAAKRLLRCNPFGKGGFDPVPEKARMPE